MKIVVNTRLLRYGQMDGIGWFTLNTLQYIVKNNPGIEFHFLFDSGVDDRFLFADNIVAHNLFPPAKHAILNLAWFEWSVKRYLDKVSPDLFFSPDGILCLGWKGPQYGVIHDINFVHIPQDLKWSNRTFYNYFFPKYIKKAVQLGTVSEFSKQDIITQYGTDSKKIDVVYCGINGVYAPVSDAVKLETRRRFSQGAEYFIFVGAIHPRKNIQRLMKAFDLFKRNTGSHVKLLLVGKEMFRTDEMHACKNELSSAQDIVFTGRLNDEDLNAVYASALCLSFVPYFEGFGIPPIEAMQCDIPVIASNVTSIPEVTGDAALLVDPYKVEDIADAMKRIWESPALREDLIMKGRVRRTVFSWERTASLLWNSIQKAL